jgi:UDP-3-O-[3-hydroxymyristoyl] glucosamine N-acyltransferase
MKNGNLNYWVDSKYRIERVCSIDEEVLNNSIVYSKTVNIDIINKLLSVENCYIILAITRAIIPDIITNNNKVVLSNNPKLEYAKLMIEIEASDRIGRGNHYLAIENSDSSIKAYGSVIGTGCTIEPFVFIGEDVIIGNDCTIKSGARILESVTIGNNVTIKSNAVVGELS